MLSSDFLGDLNSRILEHLTMCHISKLGEPINTSGLVLGVEPGNCFQILNINHKPIELLVLGLILLLELLLIVLKLLEISIEFERLSD